MISRVHSAVLQGIDAVACEVEADVVPSADKPVQESVSRIQAALRNSGYRWPDFGELSRTGPKVTTGLAPAFGVRAGRYRVEWHHGESRERLVDAG